MLALMLLAASLAGAAPSEPLEWPGGERPLEAPESTLLRRQARCRDLEELFKKVPTEADAEQMLFCLSHPSADVRASTLRALGRHSYRSFPVQAYGKLKTAVALTSKDPDFGVRYAGGDLSRSIEYWENFDSPAAQEGKRKHKGVVVRRAVTDNFWMIVVPLFGLFSWALIAVGRKKPSRRRRR